MTKARLPLAELLQKAGDADFLRSVAEAVLQILMEADVEGLLGARARWSLVGWTAPAAASMCRGGAVRFP